MIFRDHHGTSYQVYYTSQYFSSSLMRLKDMDGFTAVPNYKALSSFLSIGYIETPMCALEGVCKLGAENSCMREWDLRSMSLFPSYTMAPATPRKVWKNTRKNMPDCMPWLSKDVSALVPTSVSY